MKRPALLALLLIFLSPTIPATSVEQGVLFILQADRSTEFRVEVTSTCQSGDCLAALIVYFPEPAKWSFFAWGGAVFGVVEADASLGDIEVHQTFMQDDNQSRMRIIAEDNFGRIRANFTRVYIGGFVSGEGLFNLSVRNGSVLERRSSATAHWWTPDNFESTAYAKAIAASATVMAERSWHTERGAVGFYDPSPLFAESVKYARLSPGGGNSCLLSCPDAFMEGPGDYKLSMMAHADFFGIHRIPIAAWTEIDVRP